jgi:hypothetical protein
MRIPREIYEEFIAADPATVIRKANIRTFLSLNKICSVTLGNGRRLADIDEMLAFFGSERTAAYESVPRIRNLEESVILIKKVFPADRLTTKEITDIAHGGRVFIAKHGNRWILNYDELIKAVREYLDGGKG